MHSSKPDISVRKQYDDAREAICVVTFTEEFTLEL